jgi:transposase InsO family protein
VVRYVGDITYLPVGEGRFLYLATVLNLGSRRLAGWSIADHMRTELVSDALRAAAATRGSLHGAIFHVDHGAQYTSAITPPTSRFSPSSVRSAALCAPVTWPWTCP